jgi:hypothetical protein
MAIWAASPAGSTVPFFGGRPQHLVFHGQLADLALSLLERPIIWRPVGPLAFEALLARGQEVIAPGGQPMRLDLELSRELLQGLAAQQPQHRIGLLPGRPARLRPMILALLVVVVHRHEDHLHPCLSGVQPNRERWTGHKLEQHGAVRLRHGRMQQRMRGDHQHIGRLVVAGRVQAQAEVAVRHPPAHQDLAVRVCAELRHWPRSLSGYGYCGLPSLHAIG